MPSWSFERHMTAALRIATIVVVALAIFWTAYHIVAGSVPTSVAVEFSNWNHGLDGVRRVSYKRYLDIPFSFSAIMIFWLLYALILKGAKAEEESNVTHGLASGALIGLVITISYLTTWQFYPEFGLILAFFIGLFGAFLYPFFKLRGLLVFVVVSGFISGIGASAVVGVGIGMAAASVNMLVVALTAAIVIGTFSSVIWLISSFQDIVSWIGKLLDQFGRWLVAADVDSD
jgi:hypothetical protein